jgi:hypothetical protein
MLGVRPDRIALERELRDTLDWLVSTKTPARCESGLLRYRGPKSARYQYLLDDSRVPAVLVGVLPECERRRQGTGGTLSSARRREAHKKAEQ